MQKFQLIKRHIDFVEFQVGGETRRIPINRHGDAANARGIVFQVPKESLLATVEYGYLDDLLIGNFMKVRLVNSRFYPRFTPLVAKVGGNAKVYTRGQYYRFLWHYFRRNPVGMIVWRAQIEWEQTVLPRLRTISLPEGLVACLARQDRHHPDGSDRRAPARRRRAPQTATMKSGQNAPRTTIPAGETPTVAAGFGLSADLRASDDEDGARGGARRGEADEGVGGVGEGLGPGLVGRDGRGVPREGSEVALEALVRGHREPAQDHRDERGAPVAESVAPVASGKRGFGGGSGAAGRGGASILFSSSDTSVSPAPPRRQSSAPACSRSTSRRACAGRR